MDKQTAYPVKTAAAMYGHVAGQIQQTAHTHTHTHTHTNDVVLPSLTRVVMKKQPRLPIHWEQLATGARTPPASQSVIEGIGNYILLWASLESPLSPPWGCYIRGRMI